MKEIEVSRTEIKTFKARIKATKPHFLGKAIATRKHMTDGVNSRYKTNLSLFVPKLTFTQKKPVVMFHMSNGGGSCLMRASDPIELANKFDELASILRSDVWLDLFEEMQSISDNLVLDSQVIMDELFVDTIGFKKAVGMEKNESFPNCLIEVDR